MRFRKPDFVLLLLLLSVGGNCYAQVKRSPPRNSNYSALRVSRNKARIMCPIFEQSQYPYQGIGIKLGDPLALTYKFYPSKHWAFAADLGKAASGLYNKYYRNAFNTYLPDTLKSDQSVKYLAHHVSRDWLFETKFLYQWDASKVSKGLQLYTGLGWQWRNTRINYDYLYEKGLYESNLGKISRTRATYGPVAIVGFEYSYFSLPVSAFIELEWFTDALLDPGYHRFQGGVGLRYVF